MRINGYHQRIRFGKQDRRKVWCDQDKCKTLLVRDIKKHRPLGSISLLKTFPLFVECLVLRLMHLPWMHDNTCGWNTHAHLGGFYYANHQSCLHKNLEACCGVGSWKFINLGRARLHENMWPQKLNVAWVCVSKEVYLHIPKHVNASKYVYTSQSSKIYPVKPKSKYYIYIYIKI